MGHSLITSFLNRSKCYSNDHADSYPLHAIILILSLILSFLLIVYPVICLLYLRSIAKITPNSIEMSTAGWKEYNSSIMKGIYESALLIVSYDDALMQSQSYQCSFSNIIIVIFQSMVHWRFQMQMDLVDQCWYMIKLIVHQPWLCIPLRGKANFSAFYQLLSDLRIKILLFIDFINVI